MRVVTETDKARETAVALTDQDIQLIERALSGSGATDDYAIYAEINSLREELNIEQLEELENK